ncbi:MAG: class F sortase [Pseudonocardia sp.]|nr:class F sortase [Pseudonocardia sp.]
MPRMRLSAPHVACAVALVLFGWGVVRTADPVHADPLASTRAPWTTTLWESVKEPMPASPVAGPVPPVPPPPPLTTAERSEHPRRPPLSGIEPLRIELPSLGVGAPIVPVAVSRDGALTVPENPHVVGWWSGGGETLVLDGHVDTAAVGPGALFHLVDLDAGDTVWLTGTDGATHRFTVTEVRTYPKPTLPPDVFRSARLVIITCGGNFDRRTRQYVDNIVAYADPVP